MKIINGTIKPTQFVLILMIISFTAFNANALTIFSETFDNNSNGWKEDSNWDVTGGVYRFTNPWDFTHDKFSEIAFGLVSAADWATGSYTISYDMRFLDPFVGFRTGLFWDEDTGPGWSPSSILVNQSMEYSGTRLDQPGVVSFFPFGFTTYTPGEWNNLKVNIDAGFATLYLNGNVIGSANIPSFDMNQLGFVVHRTNAEFDNILISSSENPVPEPTTMLLLGTGLICLAGVRRKGDKQVTEKSNVE